jgi:hypothetical protein
MYARERNVVIMSVVGASLAFWVVLVLTGRDAETSLLRWHPHMHWLDKVAWYVIMAVGPLLAGFVLGVAVGGHKSLQKCKECAETSDLETMHWCWDDATGKSGYWRCHKCGERWEKWNEWRQTQDNPFNYRNEQERVWSRRLWEAASGYFLEDVFWEGPTGKGFPDKPVDK